MNRREAFHMLYSDQEYWADTSSKELRKEILLFTLRIVTAAYGTESAADMSLDDALQKAHELASTYFSALIEAERRMAEKDMLDDDQPEPSQSVIDGLNKIFEM